MVGQMIDGKLEGVRFNTRGIHNSDDVLEQLKTKYGAPSKLVPRVLTNGAGVSHNIFDATWKTGGVVVVYLSATKTIDVGFIGIHTIKAIEEMRQSGELKNKRPL